MDDHSADPIQEYPSQPRRWTSWKPRRYRCGQLAWRRFRRHKMAMFGGVML